MTPIPIDALRITVAGGLKVHQGKSVTNIRAFLVTHDGPEYWVTDAFGNKMCLPRAGGPPVVYDNAEHRSTIFSELLTELSKEGT